MTPYAPYPLNLVRDWLIRRRWWVRLVLAVVLVPWFGHFAYTRCTGQPARPVNWNSPDPSMWDENLRLPDPAVDRTKNMVAAIQSVPALPMVPVPTTAPAGMQWSSTGESEESQARGLTRRAIPPSGAGPGAATPTFAIEPKIALIGEWNPQERYHLRQIITYLEQTATSAALDKIQSLAGQPYCLSHSSAGLGGPFGGLAKTLQDTATLLTVRARYHLAQRSDFAAALRDIEAVLQLAANSENTRVSIFPHIGYEQRTIALTEITLWGHEFDLSDEQRRQAADLIRRFQIDATAVTRAYFETWIRSFRSTTAGLYTDNGRGQGWFILRPGGSGWDWLRCENLLSPFFDDRQEAMARVDQYAEEGRAGLANLAEVIRAASMVAQVDFTTRVPTNPLMHRQRPWAGFELPIHLQRANAMAAMVITAHGVECYRRRHGHYPWNLKQLVPDILPALPTDPMSDPAEPLRYRLDDKQGYVLRSVGWLTDEPDPWGRGRIFSAYRTDLSNSREWLLRPGPPQAQPGSPSDRASEETQ